MGPLLKIKNGDPIFSSHNLNVQTLPTLLISQYFKYVKYKQNPFVRTNKAVPKLRCQHTLSFGIHDLLRAYINI